ncbi:type II secretion system F family protein [Paenibacillus sp. 7541]|uniref:type II secretion system F family protein n=1 Tax=Paenibacillus sp. 7541 TaxID=2026236 RepID=UPI000BA6DBB2|nr:type II secretion system F family protein [Paenibacillus sp. 7541]PAK49739.1 pilus assembly protein TadB [Paenibacillus sp. 7541]
MKTEWKQQAELKRRPKRRSDIGEAQHKGAARSQSQGSGRFPDYRTYHLSPSQRVGSLLAGAVLLFWIGYLFYSHVVMATVLVAGCVFFPKFWRRHLLERRRRTLNLHFKQALYSISSSLSAGKSVENAFRDAVQDLLLLDPGGRSDMIFELRLIVSRLEYGEPIEVALRDFATRAAMDDITNFADVFTTCKRTGGDLVEVVRRTSSVIGEKLDIQQEISVMVSQKRFESKALLVAPFLLVLFMNLTAPDYMEPMRSGAGMMISTLALAGLGGCFWWITKMMDIQV